MKEGKSKYCGCLYYSCNALARTLSKMADEEFAGTGLSSSYSFLLMSVIGKPGIQPKEICEHLQLTPSTVTRLVEKLESRGLVERKQSGRSTEVFPTEKSLAMEPTIKAAWKNLYDRYTEVLGTETSVFLAGQLTTATEKLNT